jgi:lipopolysaccharide heptosyltransferase II
VDWYLETLKVLGVPVHWNFEWMPRRENVAGEVEALWKLNGTPTIALMPGARWENKRWPVQHFRELVKQLRERNERLRFAILGSKADAPLADAIVSAAPESSMDLTGRTSLPQMIEVIRKCSAVVTNDTGPMHVAAALGKPVVGIFGPTNPRRTGPYRQIDRALQRQDLPCIPCMKPYCTYSEPLACLRGISAQEVANEVLVRLERPSPTRCGSDPGESSRAGPETGAPLHHQ